MFNCSKCGNTSKSGESPTVVAVENEAVEYAYKDSEGNRELSFGTQIVREEKWCRECAGLSPIPKDDSVFVLNMRGAKGADSHLMKCNKGAEKCGTCRQISRFYSTLPLHHLSHALAENPTEAFSISLGRALLDQWKSTEVVDVAAMSKQKAADTVALMHLLNNYEMAGGRIGKH